MASKYEREGGRVFGIAQDLFLPNLSEAEALAKVRQAMQRAAVHYPVFLLKAESLDALNDRFDLPGPIPCTVAVDATGKEVDRQADPAREARFDQMMRRALGREPPAAR